MMVGPVEVTITRRVVCRYYSLILESVEKLFARSLDMVANIVLAVVVLTDKERIVCRVEYSECELLIKTALTGHLSEYKYR